MDRFMNLTVNYFRLKDINNAMMENVNSRDPCGINRDIRVNMEDVIAEPESLRSPDIVWMINYYCYQLAKMICYVILAIILGPFLSLIYGICFAILSFYHIWLFMPLFRLIKFAFGWAKRLISLVVDAVIIPCFHGVGHIFSGIRIQHQRLANKESGEDEIFLL